MPVDLAEAAHGRTDIAAAPQQPEISIQVHWVQ